MTTELSTALADIVGPDHVIVGDAIGEDYTHDECLTTEWATPDAVVRPADIDASTLAAVLLATDAGTALLEARCRAAFGDGLSVLRPGQLLGARRDQVQT